MAASTGQYTPVFLCGEPPWQRSLAGHSPQGHKELDKTNARLFFFPPVAEAVHVPIHLVLLGSPQAKQLSHLQLSEPRSTLTGEELPQAKKVLHLCMQGHFGCVQQFATLWTMACQSFLFRAFSRQEYRSVLANTGFHALLEHYISCFPSHQLPLST